MTAEVPDTSVQRIRNGTLLGRAGTVAEVAAAAIYLGEDATFCTGSVLTVDGGWSV
jgi:3-oxoacyl-[acyl-carrier protein] reductase